jgi:hypothetical protein
MTYDEAMTKRNELRYYRWGNEPCGKVSTWKLAKDGSVKNMGYMDLLKALSKGLIHECPYP